MTKYRRTVGVVIGGLTVAAMAAAPVQAAPAGNSQSGHSNDHRVTLPDSVPAWANAGNSVARVGQSRPVTFNVMLPLRNVEKANDLAAAVSTPGSSSYGDFLTEQEFTKAFAPSQRSTAKVSKWLRANGFKVLGSRAGNMFVRAQGTAGEVERAFHTDLGLYRVAGKTLRAPSRPLSVPASVRSAVAGITGIDETSALFTPAHTDPNGLGVRKAVANRPQDHKVIPGGPGSHGVRPTNPLSRGLPAASNPDQCSSYWGQHSNKNLPKKYRHQPTILCSYFNGGYTWSQTRKIMHWSGKHRGKGQTVGILLAYNLPSAKSDANKTARSQGVRTLNNKTYKTELTKPFTRKSACGEDTWHLEQALDIQAVHNMAPAAKIIYYGAKSCYDLPSGFAQAVHQGKASILTASYSMNGGEPGPDSPVFKQYHRTLLKAALKGIAVLFCTGDNGDHTLANGQKYVDYPASDPFATAVGGIAAGVGQHNGIVFRTGWEWQPWLLQNGKWAKQDPSQFFGHNGVGAGGGVSAYYQKKNWQKFLPGKHRHTPDIAALADPFTGMKVGTSAGTGNYHLIAGGGTSLAAPLVAGLVADAQDAQNRRLGYLNPALYQLRGTNGIQDIKHRRQSFTTLLQSGGHLLVGLDGKPESLRAHKGYDHVTGLGIPGPGFTTKLGKK